MGCGGPSKSELAAETRRQQEENEKRARITAQRAKEERREARWPNGVVPNTLYAITCIGNNERCLDGRYKNDMEPWISEPFGTNSTNKDWIWDKDEEDTTEEELKEGEIQYEIAHAWELIEYNNENGNFLIKCKSTGNYLVQDQAALLIMNPKLEGRIPSDWYWKFEQLEDETVNIKHVASGRYLHFQTYINEWYQSNTKDKENSLSSRTQLFETRPTLKEVNGRLDEHFQWKFMKLSENKLSKTRLPAISNNINFDGSYSIINVKEKIYLNSTLMVPFHKKPNGIKTSWIFEKCGDDGKVSIMSAENKDWLGDNDINFGLEIENASMLSASDGVDPTQKEHAQWEIAEMENGKYVFRNVGTGRYLRYRAHKHHKMQVQRCDPTENLEFYWTIKNL